MLSIRIAAWLVATTAFAAGLEITSSHPDGIYTQGEPIVWSVSTKENPDAAITHLRFKITRDGGQLLKVGGINLVDGMGKIEFSDKQPSVLLVELNSDEDGKSKPHLMGGAVIDPLEIPRSSLRPADFDDFWNARMADLAKVPINPVITHGTIDKAGISHSFITMDLQHGQKIRGQIARPENGQKFPAVVLFQYAGVYGLPAWNVTSKATDGWLALNVSAHDLPLDETREFYQKQDSGPLKNYAMIGNDDREKSYFLRMFLACSRAVEYLTTRPDWDGRTLVVTGTSQGGLQSVVAAALNPKVTAMIVNVPAGCDTTAALAGRATSWPYWMKNIQGKNRDAVIRTSSYFDAMNFAPRVKCPSLVAFGLLDRTATASGVYQMTTQLGGPVETLLMSAADHKGNGGTHAAFNARSKAWFKTFVETGKSPLDAKNLEPAVATKKPAKPQNPALFQVPDLPGLPRVLLIGDSISMGYTLPVRARLKDRANVHRPPENCGDTARGLARLDAWLGKGRWDVIHFNFGLHDLKYLDAKGTYVDPENGKQPAPPDVYEKRLREFTMRLKRSGAKLIFASTTPVPPGCVGRKPGDEMNYNRVAFKVMNELDVPVNDLCAYVVEQQRKPQLQRAGTRTAVLQEPANVHFTEEGYEQLSGLVVSSIKTVLP
jgi:cephalosporin-C deacetylase